MKPAPFMYARPDSVEEALALLQAGGDETKVLAGGQSFVPLLNLRMASVDAVVDLNRLSELAYIKRDTNTLCIGAMTRHRQVEVSEEVQGAQPLLARAAAEVSQTLLAALEDDLNTPKAMAEFFGLARSLNKASDAKTKSELAAQMYACGELLGLLGTDPDAWFAGHVEGDLPAEEIEVLIEKRTAAKAAGDYTAADAFRDQLVDAGITIQDGRDGTTWRRSRQ